MIPDRFESRAGHGTDDQKYLDLAPRPPSRLRPEQRAFSLARMNAFGIRDVVRCLRSSRRRWRLLMLGVFIARARFPGLLPGRPQTSRCHRPDAERGPARNLS